MESTSSKLAVDSPADGPVPRNASLLAQAKTQPRYKRLQDEERAQILRLRFREGLSVEAIATATKRSSSTVAEFLSGFAPDRTEEAFAALKGEGPRAVEKWSEALSAAAQKGDHRPMRDLLLGLGVIQEKAAPPAQVGVVVHMPGQARELLPELDFEDDV